MGSVKKYLPVSRYLEQLDPSIRSTKLTFAEIEELINAALPASCIQVHFWTNTDIARYSWEHSGFAASLDRVGQAVVFSRRQVD